MASLHLPSDHHHHHHHHHQQQQHQHQHHHHHHLHADLALNREHPSFFLSLLRSCQQEKNLWKLSILHARLLATSSIVSEDAYIGTALITAYADCRSPGKALQVFHQISPRDVVFWNALISGYVRNGLGKEALAWFEHMRGEGIAPNAVTYISVSKACGIVRSLHLGNVVADEVRKHGFLHRNPALGTALMDMYFKCGAVGEARELFEHLPLQNVVSWTALICGYVEHGLAEEALECFKRMRETGDVRPNVVTLRAALKACGIARCLEIGEEIDAEIRCLEIGEEIGAEVRCVEIGEEIGAEMRCFEVGEEVDAGIRIRPKAFDSAALGSALVSMYAKCGELRRAQGVFDELLPDPDAAAWNALIMGYAQNGFDEEALGLFRRMRSAAGASPNTATYLCLLRACGRVRSLEIGMEIDAEVREEGLLIEEDSPLGSALVDMYSKCGALRRAEEAFEMLSAPDLAAWNALITGLVRNGSGDSALEYFERMRDAGLAPDPVTYACVAKACGITGSLALGEGIHAEVRERGLLETDHVLGTALLDMYAKCGAAKKAAQVFEQLPVRNTVSWSAMISAYAQSGLGDEALHCFEQMQEEEGVRPNAVTYASVLKACSIVGSLSMGEHVYLTVRRQHMWEEEADVVLGTALVDMYSKCGDLEKAEEVFDEFPVRTVASWSALGAGYAQFGRADAVFALHKQMQEEAGVAPDAVSFLVLLTACSHAGLVKEGETLFDQMHGIDHLVSEHWACMVDLYGRAGNFGQMKKALLDHARPKSNHLPMFLSVLGACRKWRNMELARWAFQQALRLDANCLSAYVCMQNIYTFDEMQIDAEEE